MTIELIKVGANGQLEFDFESLESLTSVEFVAALKFEFDFSWQGLISAKVIIDPNQINIYLLGKYHYVYATYVINSTENLKEGTYTIRNLPVFAIEEMFTRKEGGA